MKGKIYITIIVVVIGGIVGNLLRFTEQTPDHPAQFGQIPLEHAGWSGVEETFEDFAYEVLQADTTTLREYETADGSDVQLFVAYFKSQKYGSQIHSPKHCLPGGGWRIDRAEPYRLELPDGTIKDVNRMIISLKDYQALMLYWFETRSGAIRNEYGLKLDLVKNAILFNPTDAAIVRVTVDASGIDFQKATQRGTEFLAEFHPYIQKSLPF